MKLFVFLDDLVDPSRIILDKQDLFLQFFHFRKPETKETNESIRAAGKIRGGLGA